MLKKHNILKLVHLKNRITSSEKQFKTLTSSIFNIILVLS
jgi:hypothetical protein